MTPHTVLESFIVAALSGARDDLAEQDRKRGGDGLRDMAITLTRGRTIIAVHSDFHDGRSHAEFFVSVVAAATLEYARAGV